MGELLSALEISYKLDEIYNPRVASHMKPVREYFGHMRAVDVTAEDVDAYIAARRAAGRSNTTINRETQPLGAALRLGVERRHLSAAPKIRRFSEKGDARQGWFSDHELRAVVDGLPAYLRDFVLFA